MTVSRHPALSRIAVLMTQGIGDIVSATGLLRDLRVAYPEARITAILRGMPEAALFSGTNLVDDVIAFNPARVTPASALKFLGQIRAMRAEAFIVVSDLDAWKSPLLAVFSGAKYRIGERWSPAARLYTHSTERRGEEHKVLSNRRLLSALGIQAASAPKVEVSAADAKRVATLLAGHGLDERSFIVLHPGSGAEETHKRWPAESFIQLCRRANEAGEHRWVLVGGSDETALCESIASAVGASAVSLAGKLSLSETAGVLRSANLVVGADSGVMHLAAAAGARTLSIFGPTDERRTAPFAGTRVLVSDIHCRPCYAVTPNGCGNPRCMTEFPVHRVLTALLELATPVAAGARS